ncbi:TetR family transcriptional regulator [Mycobacterium ulcerans]|uniref:TetR family transcriptional regulator n=1 Tax=Mycobacterium ulcerans TaxID=1809 RepID=UPI001E5921BD|nr:TetR family transcriptional regulator [Mycobacterium ulcerans]
MTPPANTATPARVTKRRAETRARLVDAAFRVFADKGFGHVRIEDVCAAAGYTRGGVLLAVRQP